MDRNGKMNSMVNVSDTLLPAPVRERIISAWRSGKPLSSTWDIPRALPKKPSTTHLAKTTPQLSDRFASSLTLRTRRTSFETAEAAEQEQEPTQSRPKRPRGKEREQSIFWIPYNPTRDVFPKWDPDEFRRNLCPPSPEPRSLILSTPKKRRPEGPETSPDLYGSYAHRLQKLMRRRSRRHSACRMLDFSQIELRPFPKSF